MTKTLKVYSGRNRPDLAPVYRLFEQLTDTSVQVEKVYHWDVEGRVVDERADPQADILLTNSQLALQLVEDARIFEPYAAPVAREYADWLHAPDYSWLSFTAWPRVAMINRRVLGHDSTVWPTQLEDFARPDFKGKLGCGSMLEATTIAQFAAIRVARGDGYTEDLLDRLCANGLRVYPSNLDTRESLVHENLAAVLANSSNVHVFHMEGNPVAEAWLDQDAGGLGTHVEAHTLAILKDCKHPEQARDFVDFLLGPETQSLLARLHGETPVNANAEHGWVRPLAAIRRTDAPLKQIASAFDSTRKLLQYRGFGALVTSVLGGQDGR
jgi:iron(III) transport system substrate-binding protein